MSQPLDSLVHEVAELLRRTGTRVVFAESCTGGLVSAVLARVAGISEFHCGSAVVYRLDTKTRWLGVPEQMLADVGAVSEPVANAMAVGVLQRTPEADLSAAITGHLGPNAPVEQDGLVFIGIARRRGDASSHQPPDVTVVERRLASQIPSGASHGAESVREWRQWHAAEVVLSLVRDELMRNGVRG